MGCSCLFPLSSHINLETLDALESGDLQLMVSKHCQDRCKFRGQSQTFLIFWGEKFNHEELPHSLMLEYIRTHTYSYFVYLLILRKKIIFFIIFYLFTYFLLWRQKERDQREKATLYLVSCVHPSPSILINSLVSAQGVRVSSCLVASFSCLRLQCSSHCQPMCKSVSDTLQSSPYIFIQIQEAGGISESADAHVS